jgi:hypothetical protein
MMNLKRMLAKPDDNRLVGGTERGKPRWDEVPRGFE